MLIFTKKLIMNLLKLPLFTVLLISGCAQTHDFAMGESYWQAKEVQTLDPGAPERNEGIVLPLDGQYGEAVMKAYRKSNSQPQAARGKIKSADIGK